MATLAQSMTPTLTSTDHTHANRTETMPTPIRRTNNSRHSGVQTEPIFRDAHRFSAEWQRASESLPPNRRRALEELVTQGRSRSQTAQAMGISPERVRQIMEKAVAAIRQAADLNPQGELAHTRAALTDIAEAIGTPTWAFHRMSRSRRQGVVEQLTRLEAIAPDQSLLMPAACRLTAAPPEPRPSLDNAERALRELLRSNPDGITPEDARKHMQVERKNLACWPRLDLAVFAVAKLSAGITPDGLMRMPPREPTKREMFAELMVQALREAGDCMHVRDLREAAQRLAQREGTNLLIPHSTCSNIAIEDPRFRWVAKSTYGLAEWDVGHSRPDLKAGRKIGVSDEILHLLEQRPVIPLPEVTAHINRRFRVGATTVPAAIHTSPDLTLRNGFVMRTDHAGSVPARPPRTRPTIEPSALKSAREAMGISRTGLGRMIGANYHMIRKYETGAQSPLPQRLEAIAAALGMQPAELLRQPDERARRPDANAGD